MLCDSFIYYYRFDFLKIEKLYEVIYIIKKRGDTGIEPVTSCTRNKNHTTRPIAHSKLYLPTQSLSQFYSICILNHNIQKRV